MFELSLPGRALVFSFQAVGYADLRTPWTLPVACWKESDYLAHLIFLRCGDFLVKLSWSILPGTSFLDKLTFRVVGWHHSTFN